jgi:hypothetical protein
MPANETNQLTAPFWPGHTAVIRPVKTIVQPGIPPLDPLNERATALRRDRGLLLWRDPIISANGN